MQKNAPVRPDTTQRFELWHDKTEAWYKYKLYSEPHRLESTIDMN